MTRPVFVTANCYICKKSSKQTILASTNRMGSPDLDLRPPEMERSSMSWWIQECPHCGYVANNIEDRSIVKKEWLKSDEYTSCDNKAFISELAIKFYKQYLIKVKENNSEDAFYAILHAAWACDDCYDGDNAIYCRLKALEQLEKYVAIEGVSETLLLVKADLLRRTGQFDLLIKEYENKVFSEELLCAICAFQVEKAKQKDTYCYTVSDVRDSN